MRFGGDVAIVTGAGAGLGRTHALALAAAGARVVVNDVTASAEETVTEIASAGGCAVASIRDSSTPEGAAGLVGDALRAFGELQIVVNNAGVLLDGDIAEITDDAWRRVLAVNLDSPFFVTRASWPHFRERGYGRVVFTTSASGLFGNVGHAHYSTAKAGVVGLMRAVALEGADLGIRANAIAPLALTRQSLQRTPATSSRRSARDIVGPSFDDFTPELVSTVVLLLAHAHCPETGRVVSTAGGISRLVRTAATQGRDFAAAGPDDVLAGWSDIAGGELHVPDSLADDLLLLRGHLEARATER